MMKAIGRGFFAIWVAVILACGTASPDDDVSGDDDVFGGVVAPPEPPVNDEVAAGNVVDVATDDAELQAAQVRARETLDTFLADLASPGPNHGGHAIKTVFYEGEVGEHMWVGNLRWDGTRFTGTLDNEPVNVHNVRMGQQVTVERAAVEDWLYMNGEEMVGGYTVQVLMGRQGAR